MRVDLVGAALGAGVASVGRKENGCRSFGVCPPRTKLEIFQRLKRRQGRLRVETPQFNMCGIAGVVRFDGRPVEKDLVGRMVRWLNHRGPDEHGVLCHENVGIGTARLSILDLAGGRQPIPNEDETIWVSFNGEIYNWRELRGELEAKGHRFRTRTDTEVIVHGYEEWGEEFAKYLKGMFGLAVVDFPRKRLYLARDVAGEKPIFYSRQSDVLAFASEMKPLLHEFPISRDLNPLAISSFFAFSRPVGSLSTFQGIEKLMPGTILRVDLDSGETTTFSYWHPPSKVQDITDEEAEAKLATLLGETIERFLVADVPVGAFLSGGTDSSAVVALMRRFFDQPVKTFTAVYDDPVISEQKEAQQVAILLGTEHHEIHITPEHIPAVLPKLIWHFEEPFADSSFLPTYFVSKKAREHVKVALTGDGGDELFGGYDWYLAWRVLEAYRHVPKTLRGWGEQLMNALPAGFASQHPRMYHYVSGVRRVVRASQETDLLATFTALTGEASLSSLLPEAEVRRLTARRSASLSDLVAEDALAKLLLFQFRGLLPELFFTKVDRMSMAASLECRSPLVYRDLVEFALSLPIKLKVRGMRRKYLLKKTLESFLPKDIIYRPKKGFSIPLYRWLREYLPLRQLVEYYAFGAGSQFLRDGGFVDYSYVKSTTEDYLAGKHGRWVLPWRIVCLGIWWETYGKNGGTEPLPDLAHTGMRH